VISLIEFVSKLGGNSYGVEQSYADIDDKVREAEEFYLEHEFELGLTLALEALDEFEAVAGEAMELKDRTFMWIYAIEWLVLLSTSMVTGTLVWGLMLKRVLYREVRITSLSRMVT
jgi:hypothetical protein